MPEPIKEPEPEGTNWTGAVLLGSLLALLLILSIAVFTGYLAAATVNSLSTIALVGITGVYAYLTWRLVSETHQARKDENAPVIILQVDSYGPKILNVGNGTAVDLSADLELHPTDSDSYTGENRPSLSIDREYLPVGEEIWITDRPFLNLPDEDSSVHNSYQKLSVEASYYDVLGNAFTPEKEYSLDELGGDEIPEKTPLQDIATELAAINTTLEKGQRQQ